MSHVISFRSYPENMDRGLITCDIIEEVECACYAEGGGLDRPIRWLDGIVLDSYNEAEEYIKDHDDGWYDNLAVKYRTTDKDNKPVNNWLVKFEYHV